MSSKYVFDANATAFLQRIQAELKAHPDHESTMLPRHEFKSGYGPYGGRIRFSVAKYLRNRLRRLWQAVRGAAA